MGKGKAIPTDNIPFVASADVEKLKASSVNFESTKINLKPCNHIANFDIPPKIINYETVVNYLKRSPIYEAITRDPKPMYLPYLFELWYTIQWVEEGQTADFIGTVNNGKVTIKFGLETFRNAIGLNYRPKDFVWEAPIGDKESKSVTSLIDYEYDAKAKVAVARSQMSGEWSYFFGHIIQCLGTSSGSHDQANGTQRQIAYALITGAQIDFAHLIFNDLKAKIVAAKRDSTVPYPRFLSLVIKKLMGNQYGMNPAGEKYDRGAMFPVAQVGKQIFSSKAAFRTSADGKSSKTTLSQVMLELISEEGPANEQEDSERTEEENEAEKEPPCNPSSSADTALNSEQIHSLISDQRNSSVTEENVSTSDIQEPVITNTESSAVATIQHKSTSESIPVAEGLLALNEVAVSEPLVSKAIQSEAPASPAPITNLYAAALAKYKLFDEDTDVEEVLIEDAGESSFFFDLTGNDNEDEEVIGSDDTVPKMISDNVSDIGINTQSGNDSVSILSEIHVQLNRPVSSTPEVIIQSPPPETTISTPFDQIPPTPIFSSVPPPTPVITDIPPPPPTSDSSLIIAAINNLASIQETHMKATEKSFADLQSKLSNLTSEVNNLKKSVNDVSNPVLTQIKQSFDSVSSEVKKLQDVLPANLLSSFTDLAFKVDEAHAKSLVSSTVVDTILARVDNCKERISDLIADGQFTPADREVLKDSRGTQFGFMAGIRTFADALLRLESVLKGVIQELLSKQSASAVNTSHAEGEKITITEVSDSGNTENAAEVTAVPEDTATDDPPNNSEIDRSPTKGELPEVQEAARTISVIEGEQPVKNVSTEHIDTSVVEERLPENEPVSVQNETTDDVQNKETDEVHIRSTEEERIPMDVSEESEPEEVKKPEITMNRKKSTASSRKRKMIATEESEEEKEEAELEPVVSDKGKEKSSDKSESGLLPEIEEMLRKRSEEINLPFSEVVKLYHQQSSLELAKEKESETHQLISEMREEVESEVGKKGMDAVAIQEKILKESNQALRKKRLDAEKKRELIEKFTGKRKRAEKIIKVGITIKKNDKESYLELEREGLSKKQCLLMIHLKKWLSLEELGEVYSCVQNGSSTNKFIVLNNIDKIVSELNKHEEELNLPISELKTELASGNQRKKIKRATNADKIKETLYQQELGVLPDCRGTDYSLPSGVQFIPGMVIRSPEYGMFYTDPFNQECFQRASDISNAKTEHLVAIKYYGEYSKAEAEFVGLVEKELKKRMAEDHSERFARVKKEYEDSFA